MNTGDRHVAGDLPGVQIPNTIQREPLRPLRFSAAELPGLQRGRRVPRMRGRTPRSRSRRVRCSSVRSLQRKEDLPRVRGPKAALGLHPVTRSFSHPYAIEITHPDYDELPARYRPMTWWWNATASLICVSARLMSCTAAEWFPAAICFSAARMSAIAWCKCPWWW